MNGCICFICARNALCNVFGQYFKVKLKIRKFCDNNLFLVKVGFWKYVFFRTYHIINQLFLDIFLIIWWGFDMWKKKTILVANNKFEKEVHVNSWSILLFTCLRNLLTSYHITMDIFEQQISLAYCWSIDWSLKKQSIISFRREKITLICPLLLSIRLNYWFTITSLKPTKIYLIIDCR